jgi:hypothetical protein
MPENITVGKKMNPILTFVWLAFINHQFRHFRNENLVNWAYELVFYLKNIPIKSANIEIDLVKFENIIKLQPRDSYLYARIILNRRWPEAEPIIMQDSYYWEFYSNRYLKNK